MYDQLYSRIAAWRQGKPTILQTINRYNDYIGWTDANLTPAQQRQTRLSPSTKDADTGLIDTC
jgi:hypothetical protein